MSHRKGQKKQAASPKTAPKNLKQQDEKYAPPHEFGGPIGAALGLVGLPTTIYYLWLCIEYNKGALLYPSLDMAATNSTNTTEPLPDPQEPGVWDFLVEKACPNLFSVTFYLGWLLLQALLAVFGTGPIGEGALLSDGETRLKYKFNGLCAWYTTLVLALVLHFTGLLPLYLLADNFGPLLTTASLVASAIAVYCYISAHKKGTTLRMSGIFHYDFFMGAELNPRINLKALGFSDSLLEKYKALEQFDIKFFAEIRPGIMLWFLMTLSCLMKQYHELGFVTLPMMLLCFYHLCYANACYKGEDCIPMSMDIIYEKFGWMLCYANLVWVPFTYCFPALYLVHSATLVEPPNEWCFSMLALHVFGYYIFDTANSQKDYFRARDPENHVRRGFPQFSTGKLTNPKSIPTEVPGKSLLIDGWWGVARHINYTGDLMMAWAWGLTCAFGSFIPYFYAVYMTILLVHRERRDDYDCRKKYGTIWKKYCAAVRYRFIPGVY